MKSYLVWYEQQYHRTRTSHSQTSNFRLEQFNAPSPNPHFLKFTYVWTGSSHRSYLFMSTKVWIPVDIMCSRNLSYNYVTIYFQDRRGATLLWYIKIALKLLFLWAMRSPAIWCTFHVGPRAIWCRGNASVWWTRVTVWGLLVLKPFPVFLLGCSLLGFPHTKKENYKMAHWSQENAPLVISQTECTEVHSWAIF